MRYPLDHGGRQIGCKHVESKGTIFHKTISAISNVLVLEHNFQIHILCYRRKNTNTTSSACVRPATNLAGNIYLVELVNHISW